MRHGKRPNKIPIYEKMLQADGNQAIRQSGNQAIRQSGNQAIRQSGNYTHLLINRVNYTNVEKSLFYAARAANIIEVSACGNKSLFSLFFLLKKRRVCSYERIPAFLYTSLTRKEY
jgi:hypothetical protein